MIFGCPVALNKIAVKYLRDVKNRTMRRYKGSGNKGDFRNLKWLLEKKPTPKFDKILSS